MTNRKCRPLSSTVYRVEGCCSECGAEIMVPYNRRGLRNLCDGCAREQQRQVWRRENEKRAAERCRWDPGDHRMVVDADGSWTRGTHLTEIEILKYAAAGYLAEGTVFECRGKRKVVKKYKLVAEEA